MGVKPPKLEDDGLLTPEIGAWGEQKYRLVSYYAAMFATSMKDRWGCRVYMDLFAGAGRSRIESTNRIVLASPLLALEIRHKFDKYIFCEGDESKLGALNERVSRGHPDIDVSYLHGDTNELADKILEKIPQHGPKFNVLSFCFVDPYRLRNLRFDTIRQLSSRFVDFLILIPSHMDANRNVSRYINPANETVDEFLGTPDWRADWKGAEKKGESFGGFLTDRFGRQMAAMGYLYSGVDQTKLVRSTDKNLPLYRLAFFSRNKLGQKFWQEARKYSDNQLALF